MQGLKKNSLISHIWISFFAMSLLILAGCQAAKPIAINAGADRGITGARV